MFSWTVHWTSRSTPGKSRKPDHALLRVIAQTVVGPQEVDRLIVFVRTITLELPGDAGEGRVIAFEADPLMVGDRRLTTPDSLGRTSVRSMGDVCPVNVRASDVAVAGATLVVEIEVGTPPRMHEPAPRLSRVREVGA